MLGSYQRRGVRVSEGARDGSSKEQELLAILPASGGSFGTKGCRFGMAKKKRARPRAEPRRLASETRHRASSGDGKAAGDADWYEEKAALIDEILRRVEERLKGNDFKATVGDFIRLLEIRKELEEERPREITVRWVEPCGTEDAPA